MQLAGADIDRVDAPRAAGDQHLREAAGRGADIVSIEETDIRTLDRALFAELPDFVTVDASFISLKLVLPAAIALAARPAHLLALIKPQFEAPRRHIKKGIVRDASIHAAVCAEIAEFAATLGCRDIMSFASPIEGADGNREFFLGAALG